MSLFSLIFGSKRPDGDSGNDASNASAPRSWRRERLAFVDVETGIADNKIHDIGALTADGATLHDASRLKLRDFLKCHDIDFVCGHNIFRHDARFLFDDNEFRYDGNGDDPRRWMLVDTLFISSLLFPERPYHRLVKDDKLVAEQMNNPVNDCEKAKDLLADEITEWNSLSESLQTIYASLLMRVEEFEGFLYLADATARPAVDDDELAALIHGEFNGKICRNAHITDFLKNSRTALAYALALIGTSDYHSVTPGWVLHNFPEVENIIYSLRHKRCSEGCTYCNTFLDVKRKLKEIFEFNDFRTYNGEPLQERAARAAVDGKSLLAIFPTGGGKSLTFQLPALMDGRSVHGLTVVISPLQSLMKDQVDNLADRGITDAVTINGLLDPISRALAFERVSNGDASLLYIAPEMLRSKTIERILDKRHVVRFVIDEAHCFSAWGQDFRVDYQYIGKFISEYQKRKGTAERIPVSCFTATAKQKVVQDICDYFKKWLNAELEIFASNATRTNLKYSVIHVDTDEDKYSRLRSLVSEADCPAIIYVSRTKRTKELAQRLTRDGMKALPFNGKMDADEKIRNQDAFMNGEVGIIVATSAFGMGVDKSDVGLVVHYDISDSLENYVQEAGRAGRDPRLTARCFVLYCDSDLDKHFILLNQTKLSLSEIQQVWKAVKDMTRQRPRACCSALEIARQAGWDDSVGDIETRVRTALAALEQSGYIERGNNVPHVYATGITVKNMDEARQRIMESQLFSKEETESVARIIRALISQKYTTRGHDAEAESRIDYLADMLGLTKKEVISAVERMRQEGILADSKDMAAFMQDSDLSQRRSMSLLEKSAQLERFIISSIPDEALHISYKQLNENAANSGIDASSEKAIRTLLFFLCVKGYARKKEEAGLGIAIARVADIDATLKRFERRIDICRFVIDWLYNRMGECSDGALRFSVVQMLSDMKAASGLLFADFTDVDIEELEEALLYLSKIGALKLEGGFLILYNAMDIRRLKQSSLRYKKSDYQTLNDFYKQKMQQIHIVGEYANLMVKDYNGALTFVHDYFQMNYELFIDKYFRGSRRTELDQNLTPQKYRQLFGKLSQRQKEIIDDRSSRCIVVAAGPGSGKTMVLVHKLASLLTLEDVKHEQLLMLTFSRAAATEFKQRLMQLIGNAAHFVDIKTFHSYSFDLLGRIGNLDDASDVVGKAARMIREGEVEHSHIRKAVLVIDEAQDMNCDEYALVSALIEANDDLRVIAVGDDDQNIFEFRGADSQYMYQLSQMPGSRFIEMTENYRSERHIVDAANDFACNISRRMKRQPIISMAQENGCVRLVEHTAIGPDGRLIPLYCPVADELKALKPSGSTCILTQTNEEAVIMLALLQKCGMRGKLIQSLDGFRFWNLAEARYFMKCIDKALAPSHSPKITNETWLEARRKTFEKYARSSSLPYLKRCLSTFEQTSRDRYYSDLREFLFESSVEDFCDVSPADIVVSTIHKAKGREFDNVFMLISNAEHPADETLRRWYVGMTRAKKYLSIHTNCSAFSNIRADCRIADKSAYALPKDIALQLSHRDVNLSFFTKHKQDILALMSGTPLAYHDYRFSNPNTGRDIALLSNSMQQKLQIWTDKGYRVCHASVRFIVAWKPKGSPKETEETAVTLIDLKMSLAQAENTL